MRQRSRFSRTLLCLPPRVTPDDGISGTAAAAVVVVGIEPPPPSLRTLQSAADRPPTYQHMKKASSWTKKIFHK